MRVNPQASLIIRKKRKKERKKGMNRDTWEHNARTIPRDYKIHCLDSWPLLTSVSVLVWMLNPLSSTMPLYDFESFEGPTGENLLSFFL